MAVTRVPGPRRERRRVRGAAAFAVIANAHGRRDDDGRVVVVAELRHDAARTVRESADDDLYRQQLAVREDGGDVLEPCPRAAGGELWKICGETTL